TRIAPCVSVAVTTVLAMFWFDADQLMEELPGHGTLAGNTARNPEFSVSVTVRLMTAADAVAGVNNRTTISPPAGTLPGGTPMAERVSSTRGMGLLATNALGGAS